MRKHPCINLLNELFLGVSSGRWFWKRIFSVHWNFFLDPGPFRVESSVMKFKWYTLAKKIRKTSMYKPTERAFPISRGRWFWKKNLLRTLRIFPGPFQSGKFLLAIYFSSLLYFYRSLGQTIQIDWKYFHQSSSSETLDLVVSMLFCGQMSFNGC